MGNYQGRGGLLQDPQEEQQYTYTLEGSGLMGLYFEVSEESTCFDGFVNDDSRALHAKATQGDRLLSINGVSLLGMPCDNVLELLTELRSKPKVLVLEPSSLKP